MQLLHFERLEALLNLLDLTDLNNGLQVNDQIISETKEGAIRETVEAIKQLSYRTLLSAGDINSMAACLKMKPNRKIVMQHLDTHGASAFLTEMSDTVLRYSVTTLGLTWVNRQFAIEDLLLLCASTAGRTYLYNMECEPLRTCCEKLELSKSGDKETLLDRLEEALFPIPERDRQFTLENAHTDDKQLDNLAVVTRDTRGAPESLRLTSACKDLRRLLVLICSLSQDPSLAVGDWNTWTTDLAYTTDNVYEMDVEDQVEPVEESVDEASSQILLDPVFPFRHLQLAKIQLKLLFEDVTPNAEDDYITQTRKTNIRTYQSNFALSAKSPFKGTNELLKWLDEHAYPESSTNGIAFHNLHHKFKTGSLVKGQVDDLRNTQVGYKVITACYTATLGYVNNRYVAVWNFSMTLAFLVSNGSSFLWVNHADAMRDYSKELSMSNLPYEVVDEESLRYLTDRGEKYVKLSVGPQFMGHDEESFFACITTGSYQLTAKTGRVMLDISRGRLNGHHPGFVSAQGMTAQTVVENWFANSANKRQTKQLYGESPASTTDEMTTVPKEYLALCWPAITGFNFGLKEWGYVLVDAVREIKFNDNAFDKLVLEDGRKKLIHAVVRHSQDIFTDIIAGKGGGSIFLLHGPPGTGKTLTAEAVAEVLHKPLYYVSVGELGTTPESLEQNLQAILDLASGWKAVLLMDEADVFLEQRGFREVKRNAMVGVMLKLLEYYQGILFMTSNRVQTFDAAFYSRITVALRYDALDQPTRLSIWKMILKTMNINVDPTELSDSSLNGRQIKNCATLAQSLSSVEGRETTLADLRQTVSICLDFIKDMEKQRSTELTGEFAQAPTQPKRRLI